MTSLERINTSFYRGEEIFFEYQLLVGIRHFRSSLFKDINKYFIYCIKVKHHQTKNAAPSNDVNIYDVKLIYTLLRDYKEGLV